MLITLVALLIVASLQAQTIANNPQTPLTESQAYRKVEESLLQHFQNVFMKTEDFKGRFGETAWEDIPQDVMDSMDFVRDRMVPDKITGELRDIEIMFW